MSENDRIREKDLKEQVKKSQQSDASAAEWQKQTKTVNLESFLSLTNVSENMSDKIQGSDYKIFSIL